MECFVFLWICSYTVYFWYVLHVYKFCEFLRVDYGSQKYNHNVYITQQLHAYSCMLTTKHNGEIAKHFCSGQTHKTALLTGAQHIPKVRYLMYRWPFWTCPSLLKSTIILLDIEGTCCGKDWYVNIFITKMCAHLLHWQLSLEVGINICKNSPGYSSRFNATKWQQNVYKSIKKLSVREQGSISWKTELLCKTKKEWTCVWQCHSEFYSWRAAHHQMFITL